MEGKVVNDSNSSYSFLYSSPVSRVDYSVIVAIFVFIFVLRLKYFLTNSYKKKCSFSQSNSTTTDICLLASDLETLSIGNSLNNSEFLLEKPITSWLNDLQKLDLLPYHKLIRPHTLSSDSSFIKPSIFSSTNSSCDLQSDKTDVSLSTITKKLSLFDEETIVNNNSFIQWREDEDDFMEWMEEGGTSNNGIISVERKCSSVLLYTSCIATVGVISLFLLYTILPEQFVHFL